LARAVRRNPRALPGEAQVDLAELLRRGDLDQAIESLRAKAPRTYQESLYLAWLEQKRGEHDASILTLELVLAERPNDARARLLLAHARWLEGDLRIAARELAELAAESGEAAGVAEDARSDLEALTSMLHEAAPAADAMARLNAAYFACVLLLVVLVSAALLHALRRGTGS
jgi:hypothetical protein